MKIPKIIHQTWKDGNVPLQFQPYVDGWRSHHPQWQYKLWTDEMNRAYVADYFPDFLSIYDNYPTAIQKVDTVRYLILLKEGGLFIDLDFECLRPIDPLLGNATFVVGREPDEHAARHRKGYILSNAFMAGIAGHNFLQFLCDDITSCSYLKNSREKGFNAILDCAGPFMLSRNYEAYITKEEINVIECAYLFPLIKDYRTGNVDARGVHTEQAEKPYAVHHYWGSWWKKS